MFNIFPETHILNVLNSSLKNQNQLFFLKHEQKTVVLKLFDANHKNEYMTELNAMYFFKKINKFKYITPNILSTGIINDNQYILMNFISGIDLETSLPTMSRKDIIQVSNHIINLIKSEKTTTSLPFVSHDKTPLILKDMQRAIDRLKQVSLSNLPLSNDDLERALYLCESSSEPQYLHFITQDLRLRHILWENNQINGIVDFEYAKFNDISFEIGHLFHDILSLQCANGFYLFQQLYKNLQKVITIPDMQRVFLYMIKQGITTISSKLKRNLDRNHIHQEACLIKSYIQADNFIKLIEMEKQKWKTCL